MTAKDIIFSVCEILAQGNDDGGQGTGFFVEYNETLYLVTNRHVLCGKFNTRDKLTLRCNVIKEDDSYSYGKEIEIPLNQANIIKDTIYDIAMYPINEIVEKQKEQSLKLNYYFIHIEDMEDSFDDYAWIEDIYLIGYSWDIRTNSNRPIVMKGITSTPLPLMLENKMNFLTDFGSSHGSSGSPIFIQKNNAYQMIGIIFGNITGNNHFKKKNENNEMEEIIFTGDTKINMATKSNVLKDLIISQSSLQS